MPLTFSDLMDGAPPLDFSGVTPERFVAASLDEVRRAPVLCGSSPIPLGELFRIQGDPRAMQWRFETDCRCVHALGAGMTRGAIEAAGDVGRRAGAGMQGGSIVVHGNAGDRLGAEMSGGFIRVHGDAGNRVAAALPGSRLGMIGGKILIHGNAGEHVGDKMRRGLIAIAGSAGQWLGMRMLAGTILVQGACGPRPGTAMKRGTIIALGDNVSYLLPTFRHACQAKLPMMSMLQTLLVGNDFPMSRDLDRLFAVWRGDMLELGRGEVLVAA